MAMDKTAINLFINIKFQSVLGEKRSLFHRVAVGNADGNISFLKFLGGSRLIR